MNGKRLLAGLLALLLVMPDINMVKASEADTISLSSISGEVIEATGVAEHISSDGKYKFTMDEQYNYYATITAYLGNESSIVVPSKITDSTGTYVVKTIADLVFESNSAATSITIEEGIVNIGQAFCGCPNLQMVKFPSTTASVPDEAFNESYKLQAINVTEGGDTYLSRDGVLFYYKNNELFLQTYPEGKEGTSYFIDKDVKGIRPTAFLFSQYLQNISIPGTIKYVFMRGFDTPVNAMTIYFNPETLDNITNLAGEAFYKLPAGSKIIVKNTAIATEMANHLSNCTGVTIIDLSQDASYKKVADSLTFQDGSKTMSKTVGIGETDTSLLTSYVITPADTTDNVTWTSDNENIATVDSITGKIQARATGECTITGKDESNNSITVYLTVYQAIESVELYCGSSNPDSYTVTLDGENNTKWISFVTTPNRASNWENTVWESSDPTVATIQKDETDKEYALLTFLSPGTTTITATIDGTTWTKSFVLHVEQAKKALSDCTIKVSDTTYTGTAQKPDIKITDGTTILKEGTDYTVSFNPQNTKAGTAMATISAVSSSSYTGTVSKTFTIKKATYDMSKVAWTSTKFTYNGSTKQVTLTGLPKGVTATYFNYKKIAVGTYTVAATLSYDTENYNEPSQTTYKTTWSIAPASQSIAFTSKAVSNNIITVPYGTKTFKLGGKAKTPVSYSGGSSKVAIVDKSGNVKIKGTGYTTITVTAKQTTSYKKATTKLLVYITPKKESITYLKSNSKSALTVKWKKDTTATGYQIQYSTSSKFTAKATKTLTNSKNSTYVQTIKKLSAGRKYYVRVRAYKTVIVSGKSVKKYASWSSSKAASIM